MVELNRGGEKQHQAFSVSTRPRLGYLVGGSRPNLKAWPFLLQGIGKAENKVSGPSQNLGKAAKLGALGPQTPEVQVVCQVLPGFPWSNPLTKF